MLRKGLTLVELLVVMAIIGVLLPVGAYSLSGYRQAQLWRAQVAGLEGLLRTGGQYARSSGQPVELVVSGQEVYLTVDGNPLYAQGGREVAPHLRVLLNGHLQAGSQSGGSLLRWRPSGRVEGARTLELTQGRRRAVFALSPWGELEVSR
jgi:prepilin-type N-terminal cleavage/methylation domain-containing protein